MRWWAPAGTVEGTILPEPEAASHTLRVISSDNPFVAKERYKKLLPLFSLKAAAGYFGDGEAVEPEGWVDASNIGRLNDQMFVARVIGRSMEPNINDGDYCVFRVNPHGSRNGKIVLIQSREISDPETGGSYTVKRYRSTKEESDEGASQF